MNLKNKIRGREKNGGVGARIKNEFKKDKHGNSTHTYEV